MGYVVGHSGLDNAVQWMLELPLVARLFGSAAVIFVLSLLVSMATALQGRQWRRPGTLCGSVGISTAVAFVGWSVLTRSGSFAVYQCFGGAIAALARVVLVSNRVEVLDWISARVDKLSYKVVYVVLALLMALPFVVGAWPSRPRPRPITRGIFDAIEECAESGKPVLLINAWRMSSRGENQPQFDCVIEHMMRRRVKFVMLSMEVDTTIVGRGICQETEEFYNEEFGDDYLQYGRDWLLLGYKAIYQTGYWPAWVESMKTKGMVGAFRTDYAGRDLKTYEIMQRPESALREEEEKRRLEAGETTEGESGQDDAGSAADETEEGQEADQYLQLGDFGLILEIHFTGTLPELIGLVRLDKYFAGPDGKPKIQTGLGTVNMVVNQMLPFYDSGDMSGILAGLQGAVEYSELLEAKYGKGPSRKGVTQRFNPYSVGVLFVLSLIILGNLSTLWMKLGERRETSGAA